MENRCSISKDVKINSYPVQILTQPFLSLAEDLYGRIMDDIRDEVGLVLVIASQYQKPRCIRLQRRYERD